MKFLFALCLTLLLLVGCSNKDSRPLTESEFTQDYVKALKAAHPDWEAAMVGDREVKIKMSDGHELTAFLDNAYASYKQDPKAKAEVIQRYLETIAGTSAQQDEKLDPKLLVPVIKDRPWVAEMRRLTASRSAKQVPELLTEDFNADLVIAYAMDLEKGVRFLNSDSLKDLKLEKEDLRKLACDNLKRLLPDLQCKGANGMYMLTAGGTYEASLLLFDSLWTPEKMKVEGDYVVALPARDLLLVTGSRQPQELEKVRKIVKETIAKGDHTLTDKLFVRRNGKFEEFRGE